MPTHPQLFARIEQYAFDNPSFPNPAFGFLDRLCVETGWSKAFATGAIREYRRFVYLAVTGDRPVTPSREVDAVWHLHLTYTRGYWERLIPILPRPLHHEPTPGGQVAATIYRSQYADTKARYFAEFGENTPDAYWPPEEERFQPDMRQMRRGARAGRTGLIAGGAAAMMTMLAMPAFAADGLSGDMITLIALVLAAGIVLLWAISYLSGAGSPTQSKEEEKRGDGGGSYVSSCGSSGGKGDGKGDADGAGDSGGDGGGGGCGGGCGS
jgi:hypothetical protein